MCTMICLIHQQLWFAHPTWDYICCGVCMPRACCRCVVAYVFTVWGGAKWFPFYWYVLCYLFAVSLVSMFRRYWISSVDICAVGGCMTSRCVFGVLYEWVYVGTIGGDSCGYVSWYCCMCCWWYVWPYYVFCVGWIYCLGPRLYCSLFLVYWVYVVLYLRCTCWNWLFGLFGGGLFGWGRYTFFGRDSKNLYSFVMTSPACFSSSMFSQLVASNLHVRFITSPRSMILIGFLFV